MCSWLGFGLYSSDLQVNHGTHRKHGGAEKSPGIGPRPLLQLFPRRIQLFTLSLRRNNEKNSALICVWSRSQLQLCHDMSREIDAATTKILPRVVEWRRHIHQYPDFQIAKQDRKVVEDLSASSASRCGPELRKPVSSGFEGLQRDPVIGLRATWMRGRHGAELASVRLEETSEYHCQRVGVMNAADMTPLAMLMAPPKS